MDSVDSRSGSSLWVPASRSGPADRSGHIPLSFQQEFLRLVDKGDQAGPFGPRYTIVGGWRLRGPLDLPALRAPFSDLVVRHEALRTTIVRSPTEAYQVVHPPREPDFQVWDLASAGPGHRDGRAEEFLNELGATTVDAGEVPQLRAVLGRFDQRDAVLVLAAHHTAVDGWSIQVLMRDLASLYSARRRGFQADLPPARQYQEYVAWQRANAADPAVVAAKEYWRGRLDGARVLPVRTDRPRRPDEPGSVTSWYRFLIPDELRTATTGLASQLRSSTFMVLLSAHMVQMHWMTGITDLVVPTFTPGRAPAWTQSIVGSFFNLVPLRTDIAGCVTFRDVVGRARATCLSAYAHELPFIQVLEVAPELMLPAAHEDFCATVFQVVQSPFMMAGERVGELDYTAMRRRLRSQHIGSEIPDGALWELEPHPAGGIVGSVGFCRSQFDEATVAGLAEGLQQTLQTCLSEPDRPLDRD